MAKNTGLGGKYAIKRRYVKYDKQIPTNMLANVSFVTCRHANKKVSRRDDIF